MVILIPCTADAEPTHPLQAATPLMGFVENFTLRIVEQVSEPIYVA